MNRFKIAFFMMAAMICIAATSWGDSRIISLNNNKSNDFIVVYIESQAYSGPSVMTFEPGKINLNDINSLPSVVTFPENEVKVTGWGDHPAISLNDNNTFIEANLGAEGKQIYYNAGKIDPETHEITFTQKGLTFGPNVGSGALYIHLDNNGNFIEVHNGENYGSFYIVKTKKFPFFKKVYVANLYYVTGKIIDGRILISSTEKYCGYGKTPIITTTDADTNTNKDSVFTEIHAGPDSGSPYSIIGSIDEKGNFLSYSGEGIAVPTDKLKSKDILAVTMTKVKDDTKNDYNVNLFTQSQILHGFLPDNGQIAWGSCVDNNVTGDFLAANDNYLISFHDDMDENPYHVKTYNSSGN